MEKKIKYNDQNENREESLCPNPPPYRCFTVCCNFKGEKGNMGSTGPAGPNGPGTTGEKGEKGDKGNRGAKGDNGEKGEKGETGAHGDKGLKGDKGNRGAKGDTGPTGMKGEKGTLWELIINDPGVTLDNWTQNPIGVWTANPLATPESTNSSFLEYNIAISTPPFFTYVLQVDVRFPSSATYTHTSNKAGGLIFEFVDPISSNPNPAPVVFLDFDNSGGTNITNTTVHAESYGGGNQVIASYSFAMDTTYTLRVLPMGNLLNVYVNNVFVLQNSTLLPAPGSVPYHVGVWEFQAGVEFTNLKVWALALPM